MQMFVLMSLQFHAAQQCLWENAPPSAVPDEESHLNSSSTVAQPEGEIAGGELDPIPPLRPAGNEAERATKQ